MNKELADAEPILYPEGDTREEHEVATLRQCTYLQKLVDVDACLVDHSNIEWPPILKEGEIKELVIDREVVIYGIVVWRNRGATSRA